MLIIKGVTLVAGGITAEAAGIIATSSGIGAAIGVPIVAVATAVVAEGALVTASGATMVYSSYNKGKENAAKVNEVKKPEIDKGKLKEDVEKLDEKIGKVDEGAVDPELKLISEYANNDVFGKSVSFNAGEGGTGITYKVFQRNDIDWDMVRTAGAKKGRGLTNAEAAERYGLAPILDADGNVATLHHSQQHSVGPLFEASTRYHNISNAKRAPLNPFNPMSEEVRNAFPKVDSIEYWKTRGRDAMKGVK